MPESVDVWQALMRAKGMSVSELADELHTTRRHAQRLLTGKRSADLRREELDNALALGERRSAVRPLYGIAVLADDGFVELLQAGNAQPLFADHNLAAGVAESLTALDERVCVVPVWPDYAWRRTIAFHAALGRTAEARNLFVVDDPRLELPVDVVVDEIQNGYCETLQLRAAAEDPEQAKQLDSILAGLPHPAPPGESEALPPSRLADTLPGLPTGTIVEDGTSPVATGESGTLPQSRPADTVPGSTVVPESRLAETRVGAQLIATDHPVEEVRAGTQIGTYRVASLLGEGDMAAVYLADRVPAGGPVALKVLAADADETLRHRFRLESSHAAMLEHPNIPHVYDVGEADGYSYIACEYVPGMNLKALLALEGWLDPDRALAILDQIASALDALHERGLVHRDVEPGNILVSSGEGTEPTGHAYLTDFGLTKGSTDTPRPALTAASEIVGNSHYMAPEQIVGSECDHRADVYALGCVLYETLCGEPPFLRPRDSEVLYAHLQDPSPAVSTKRPDLPVALDAVIARALAKERDARYGGCAELIEAAGAALEPSKLWLTVTAGNASGLEIEVGDEFLIGRLAREEGRLGGDVELSREHARIKRTADGDYVLEDLRSTNGTYVNGRQIFEPHVVVDGDMIEVGVTTLHASRQRPVLEPEPPAPSRMAETRATPLPPVVGPDGRPLEPLPRLSLRLDVDWATGEVMIGLDVDSEPIRLVRDGDAWVVARDD